MALGRPTRQSLTEPDLNGLLNATCGEISLRRSFGELCSFGLPALDDVLKTANVVERGVEVALQEPRDQRILKNNKTIRELKKKLEKGETKEQVVKLGTAIAQERAPGHAE